MQRVRWQPTGEQRQKLSKGATENPAAYQLYLKGNFFASKFTKEGLQKGLDYFNQAIAVDPNYALAYTGVGFYYVGANDWYQSPKEAMPKARDAARKALAIDDTLADAHLLLGTVAHWYDWDWATAEREYKRGIELNPNDPRPHEFYSWFLSTNMARADEAIAEAKKAQQLDPVSAETNQFWEALSSLPAGTTKQSNNCVKRPNSIRITGWPMSFSGKPMNKKANCRKPSQSFNAHIR